jgi:hypothetical protein
MVSVRGNHVDVNVNLNVNVRQAMMISATASMSSMDPCWVSKHHRSPNKLQTSVHFYPATTSAVV